MKPNFQQKMAELAGQAPAQIHYKPTAHARIGREDVQARLMVSAVFGLGAFAASLIAILAFDWQMWPFSIAAGVVVFLGWMYFEMLDAKNLQYPVDQQQAQQQPQPPQKHTFAGELKNGSSLQMIEFDVKDPYAVERFARKVIQLGEGFSEKTAGKVGISQGEWEDIRNQFFKLGWAQWKNPNWHRSGITLFEPGRVWLEQVAKGE